MVSVKECCCGCSLRTGSLILLWIGLVLESFNFICRFFMLLVFDAISSSPSFSLGRGKGEDDRQTVLEFLSITSIIFLIESFVSAIFCVCGLIGIDKNIPKYLTFGVCYFGYEIGRNVAVLFLLIYYPRTGSTLVPCLVGSKSSKFNDADARVVEDVANGFSSAFIFAFAHVLRYLFFLLGGSKTFKFINDADARAVEDFENGLSSAFIRTYVLGYLFLLALLTYSFIVVKRCTDAMRKDAVDRGANKTFDANAPVYHYKA